MSIANVTSIGIIGMGVVGHAQSRCWMEHYPVLAYDKDPARSSCSFSQVMGADLIFVCLPTPQIDDGLTCDLNALHEFFNKIAGSSTNLVLRSTVPIGTTWVMRKKYELSNLIFSPEFLTARCAVADAQTPARNIVGGVDCRCRDLLATLYRRRFPGIPLFVVSSNVSEAAKLGTNGFFAVKLAYLNELRQLCDTMGLEWDDVLSCMLADGRISHAHTKVPGLDSNRFGFGGSCLPGHYQAKLESGRLITLTDLKALHGAGEVVKILATDSKCEDTGYRTVIEVTKRPYNGMMVVLESGGTEFVCTPEHLMPVLREGRIVIVQAQDIVETDNLMVDDEAV